MQLTRRAALAAMASVPLTSLAQPAVEGHPSTGEALPGLEHLDRAMLETLREEHLPGAGLAIFKEGRLLLVRGYGWADFARREPVQPLSRFNIASCTKPFTAVAILKLADEGKLNLDAHVFRLMPHLLPPREQHHPHVLDITIRHLLHHAGGFIKSARGSQDAASLEALVRLQLAEPLDYPPGTQTHYSNFGFLLLRLVVEHGAKMPYAEFVQEHVLRPLGITDMRLDDRPEGYFPGEVKRYVMPGHQVQKNGRGPLKGGGCWVASPLDMARFITGLDGTRGKPLLSPRAYAEMLAPLPPPFVAKPNGPFNGLGWDVVRKMEGGWTFNKNGGVAGIQTFMVHLPNGVDWAVGFNGTTAKVQHEGEEEHKPARARINQAILETRNWPEGDLHARYRGPRQEP